MKIKIGIIGLGHVAKYQIEALKHLKEYFEIYGLCDIDLKKERKNYPFYSDYKKMLSHRNLDAVLISTPNKYHFEITKYIIPKVKYILLEKPATLALDNLKMLYKLSNQHGTLLHIAFHAKYARDLQWFINNINKEKHLISLGKPKGFECNFFDPYFIHGKIVDKAISLNGSWIDSGVNALSVVYSIFDNIVIENSIVTKIEENEPIDISAYKSFFIKDKNNNGYGVINTNWTLNKNYKTTKIFFNNFNKKILLDHSAQKVYLIDSIYKRHYLLKDLNNSKERLVNHYIGVLKDFYFAIITNKNNSELSLKIHKSLFTLCH